MSDDLREACEFARDEFEKMGDRQSAGVMMRALSRAVAPDGAAHLAERTLHLVDERLRAHVGAQRCYGGRATLQLLDTALGLARLDRAVIDERDADDGQYHCCKRCGFVPLEGMKRFIEIHGEGVACIGCNAPLPSTFEWEDGLQELLRACVLHGIAEGRARQNNSVAHHEAKSLDDLIVAHQEEKSLDTLVNAALTAHSRGKGAR